ncbi:hypothetical protein SAY87_024813 [Trapa incisa]|uniref:V-type proton ATPase subunit E n=1 Tax=Trapa incisa TaxID=236973 RepID=A0AAN7GEY7_9MYRT|nr:hypothetical protein SAY87_024813 [Trapa incisa]
MNANDLSRQIQKIVRFIRQESEEKANDISVSAEEEFNIEKLQLVETEKKKIRQEYERKENQVEVRKKIEYSMQLNASRIKVLQSQDDVVTSMKDAARKDLLSVSRDHPAYKNLLKDLIVQSLLKLKEPAVLLRCRKDDVYLVESVLDSAKEEYVEKANVHIPEVIVDYHVYLPPAPSHHNAHSQSCSGGVVLASRDGKIVCENTLDARLDVVFHKKLPEDPSSIIILLPMGGLPLLLYMTNVFQICLPVHSIHKLDVFPQIRRSILLNKDHWVTSFLHARILDHPLSSCTQPEKTTESVLTAEGMSDSLMSGGSDPVAAS